MPAHREPADLVFTDHLRTLAAGREADGAEMDRVLDAIGRLLRRQMRWHGLWNLPPGRLGVIGYRHWRERGALDELRHDAYQDAILGRLRGLVAQLAVKPQVEGLAATNLKWFLRDLQRRGDPLGYRAWEVVHNAVERAVESGVLVIAAGEPPADLATLLATSPEAAERVTRSGGAVVESDADDEAAGDDEAEEGSGEPRSMLLAERAAVWNAELLPRMVLAGGRKLDAVIDELAALLPELAAAGLESFRLRELVAAVRDDLRPRWRAMIDESEEWVPPSSVRQAGPDEPGVKLLELTPPEVADPERIATGRDAWGRLTRCIEAGLQALPAAGEAEPELVEVWRADEAAFVETGESLSDRAAARQLGLSHQRMARLRAKIDRVKRECGRRLGLAADDEEGR